MAATPLRRANAGGLPGTLRRAFREHRFAVVLVLLVALFAFFAATQETFTRTGNIEAMLTSISILFVVSIGMTFVMLSGGFDLSAGSVLALSGILFAKLFVGLGLPAPVAVLLTLLIGGALGALVNGVLIGRVGLSFLVVTLGTFSLYRGVLNVWSGAETTQVNSTLLDSLAFDKLAGVPIPVWIMIATFAVSAFVLRRTYFGRDVYAVGGNPDAARLSGIKVPRTIMAVYGIAGLCAAIGGILQVSRVGAASPVVGDTIVFDAAAAVLLGGTSFAGGVGGVTGTAVGVLFLGVLQNGLSVSGVQSFWQQVITGTIVIVAVLVEKTQREGLRSLAQSLGLRRRPRTAAPAGQV